MSYFFAAILSRPPGAFRRMLATALVTILLGADAGAWWNTEWTIRKKITIDTTAAGGQIGEAVMVDLPMKPGLVKVQMTQPVKDGQPYDWSFTAKCGDASANPMTASRIQIASDAKLVSVNQSLPLPQQAANYADKGYWYDALTLTLQSKAIVDSDLESLLQSGGLNPLVEKLRVK